MWFRSTIDPSRSSELILFSTALPIDPALTDNNAGVALKTLLLLTDVAPTAAPIYSSSARNTADVYSLILANRALELQQLSPDEKNRNRRLHYVLLRYQCFLARAWWWYLNGSPPPFEYSKKYRVYLKFAKEEAALRTRASRELDPIVRAELLREASDVRKKWESHGHKAEVDKALADLRDIRSRDPEKFWADAVSQYRTHLRLIDGVLIPSTEVNPMAELWTDESGWRSWSSGRSRGLAKTVAIERNWMNDDVLTTHKWSWGDGQFKRDKTLVSDGEGFATTSKGAELMPFLPVQLLLVKAGVAGGISIVSDTPMIAGVICQIVPRLPAR